MWRQVLQQWEGRQPERRTLNQALEDVLSGEQVFQVRGWGGRQQVQRPCGDICLARRPVCPEQQCGQEGAAGSRQVIRAASWESDPSQSETRQGDSTGIHPSDQRADGGLDQVGGWGTVQHWVCLGRDLLNVENIMVTIILWLNVKKSYGDQGGRGGRDKLGG